MMVDLDDVANEIGRLVSTAASPRPVVVYSALWPLALRLRQPPDRIADVLTDRLLDLMGEDRSLLMPTFTHGFRDGYIDLDREPASTGVMAERFRLRPGLRRTASAFFSFAVAGPDASEVTALRPDDAWGDGSLYHWMERRDALFLLIGTHLSHSSYLHRIEWILRDRISYRFQKEFEGRIRLDGKDQQLRERLFVRCLDPEVINDFRVLEPFLLSAGAVQSSLPDIGLAAIGARTMRDVTEAALAADPYFCVSNRSEIAACFSGEK